MTVVGVLTRSHSADDLAVFADLKTSWIIQGLVHGHEDVTLTRDDSVVMERSDGYVVASPKLMQYTEITEQNIDSYHFHGDPAEYPISAVIAVPHDTKSGTLLRGRYLDRQRSLQIVQPPAELKRLLAAHPAKWMIWEGEPNQTTVGRLKSIGVNSLVFDPCANVPENGDFMSVMRGNIENLALSFTSFDPILMESDPPFQRR